MEILDTLKERNPVLYCFGLINVVAAILMIILSFVKPIEVVGVNAWYKPIKFALSTTILSWSVGWYTGYLPAGRDIKIVNWIILATLAFEVIYIAWQASKGEASHFNLSTPFYSFMYSMMAFAATLLTLAVGYIGLKFFNGKEFALPDYYIWAIRLGFILFVVFSFQGFLMGGRLKHSVGGPDGSGGIPFLNWSLTYGDLRAAHFVGMHALQLLPLLAWYVLKDLSLTIIVSILYGLLACFVLIQALRGNSIIHF